MFAYPPKESDYSNINMKASLTFSLSGIYAPVAFLGIYISNTAIKKLNVYMGQLDCLSTVQVARLVKLYIVSWMIHCPSVALLYLPNFLGLCRHNPLWIFAILNPY